MWVYVQDYGKMFIWENLRRYLIDSPVLLIMMAVYVALVIGFAVKGTKRERAFFVWPGVVWLLTVFNPLIAIPMINLFHVDERFYRYFWLLPLPFLLGYMLIRAMERCGKKGKIAIIVAVLALCIVGRQYVRPYLGMTHNIYKVSEDIMEMSEAMQKDSDQKDKVALYDTHFFYEMRTYDASVRPYVGRYEMEDMMASMPTDEMINEAVNSRNFHELIKYEYFGGYELPQELMQEALQTEELDYIILSKDKTAQYQNFLDYGCEEVDDIEGYWLLRCPERG